MNDANGAIGTRRARSAPDTLAPDGSEIRLLIGPEDRVVRASLCEVGLPPGEVSRAIRHRTVEEIWYVLAGRGRVWRSPTSASDPSATVADVGPGDALTVPRSWAFQFQATDVDEPLRFLCYTSPPWPGEDEAIYVEAGGLGNPTV
jgi:mannose-6-phosphate isomerase-like protein (cupin superfamily)